MAYSLPGVKPWVKSAADEIGGHFNVGTIYGLGLRPDLSSDHPIGLALDFMVYTDKAKGDSINAYVLANAARLGVKYSIWQQHIWNIGGSNHDMANRGSNTANHKDHVHVSFKSTPGTGGAIVQVGIPNPLDSLPNPLDGINELKDMINKIWDAISGIWTALVFLSDPHNWLRMAMGVSGAALIVIALAMAGQAVDKVKAGAKSAGEAAAVAAAL